MGDFWWRVLKAATAVDGSTWCTSTVPMLWPAFAVPLAHQQ